MSVGDATDSTLPTKRIISRAHLQAFLESPTHADLVNFITETNESVVGHKLTEPIEPSPVSQDASCVRA
jgi:serine/threonine-protein phosphatase 2A activator